MWPTVPLKRLVDPFRPITYGIVQAGPDAPGGIPYIRPVDMSPYSGVLDATSLRRTTVAIAREYRRSTIATGDVVVSIGPSFGKTMVVPSELGGANLTQGTARVAPDSGVVSRYLYWALQSAVCRQHWEASVGGATFRALNLEPLGRTPVPVPPSNEQRRIADFLDAETVRMDKMLALSQRLREVLKERNSARKSMVLRGVDKPGGRTDHPMLGNLPDGWKVKPLRRLVPRIGVGVVVDPSSYFSDKGVPFLRGSNIFPGEFHLDDVKRISEVDSRRLWRSQLFEGDIVVVRAGDPGRAAVVTQDLNGANCASVLVLKKGNALLPAYLAAYFNSALGAAYVDYVRYGAAQEQINVSHVVDFMVPVPSISEQRSIVDELDRSAASGLAMGRLLEKQSKVLGERRQALITAAVTGQIDASTASGRGIED